MTSPLTERLINSLFSFFNTMNLAFMIIHKMYVDCPTYPILNVTQNLDYSLIVKILSLEVRDVGWNTSYRG